jgi:Uma2 family endonuclease
MEIMASVTTWMTAEEFQTLPDDAQPRELVRGQIVMMSRPGARHGWICNRIGRLLGNFVEERDLGFVFNNDSGVVTEENPDTVRGPDIAFYSYQRMPKEQGPPEGYPEVAPDLVVEVLSPNDRWGTVLKRVGEYLDAGTLTVCVVDPRQRRAKLYYPDRAETTVEADGTVTFPELLPGFQSRVADFLGW